MSRKRKAQNKRIPHYVHTPSGRFTVNALNPVLAGKHVALVNNEPILKVEKKRD